MAKKQPASSPRARPTAKNAGRSRAKTRKVKPTDAELAAMTDAELAAIGYTSMSREESRAHARTPEYLPSMKRLAATRDEDIDYSEIPPISDKRLAAMVRANQCRPVKRTVTMRVDADVLEWLKTKSGGSGYQTRLNAMLRGMMLRDGKR